MREKVNLFASFLYAKDYFEGLLKRGEITPAECKAHIERAKKNYKSKEVLKSYDRVGHKYEEIG